MHYFRILQISLLSDKKTFSLFIKGPVVMREGRRGRGDFFLWAIYYGRMNGGTLPKIVHKLSLDLRKSFDSAISEILQYTQTDRQTSCFFLKANLSCFFLDISVATGAGTCFYTAFTGGWTPGPLAYSWSFMRKENTSCRVASLLIKIQDFEKQTYRELKKQLVK